MIKIFGPVLMVLLCICYTNTVTGVDEDYFIPYTDDYGYEYDPETGTYIKRESATSASETQQQSSAHDTNVTAVQQSESSTVQAKPANENSSLGLTLLVAGAILIGGGVMVFVRRHSSSK